MKDSRMNYLRKAGFAALLGSAALTHAQYGPPTINFCPTGANTNLTCSPCTYNMTCNLNGGGLTIVGNGIKLNGNGHSISFSPGDGVTITGAGVTISNLNVSRVKGHGVRIVRSTTNLSTEYLNNVSIVWPGYDKHGVSREGAPYSSVYMKNSYIEMAYYGIWSPDEQRGARYIDVFDSYLDGNIGGFVSLGAATQHHARNTYRYNSNFGAWDQSTTNAGYYSNNNFDYNRNMGILVGNNGTKTITLSGNSGFGNAFDCRADPGTALIATGNTWGTNHGCVSTR